MDYDKKKSFLERLLGQSKYSHNTKEAEFFCCFCTHHKPKLSINLETDNWKCWVCGKNGTRLLYVINTVGTKADVEEYVNRYKAKHIFIDQAAFSFKVDLPRSYCALVNRKNSFMGRRAYSYLLETRKIDEEDVLLYKIGLDQDNQDKLILPSFDKNGNVNFYTTRQIKGGYFNLEGCPKGYKNTIILNELNIEWDKPVVLVEGFFDMLKSVPNTIPLFGSEFVRDSLLFESIVSSKATVMLALDPDAVKKTLKISELLTAAGVEFYFIDVEPFKDVGEMSKQEFKSRYDNAKKVDWNQKMITRIRAL